jgi:Fe2+ or Zn2+ uptake regulation protein
VFRQQTETVFDVLSDKTARAIFTHIHECPQSAKDLQETCSASLKTVYRRLENLQEAGLVLPVEQVDEEGTHYTVYATAVEEVEISVKPGDSSVEVEIHEEDNVDRFVSVWSELQNEE